MKGHIAVIVPALERVKLPLSIPRDQLFLLFIVLNELLLGLETYLAHSLNGTVRFNEWIPVVCGPIVGMALLMSLPMSRRSPRLGLALALAALLTSIIVGGLGTYFHFVRSFRPLAAPGERVSMSLLVWGPSVLAPPSFVLVGIVGLIALSQGEQGAGALPRSFVHMALPKDQAYFLMTSLGVLIAATSSLLDHLRGDFDNPWLWVPLLCGILGTVVAFVLGFIARPSRGDLTAFALAMGLLIIVGPLGLVLHILHDLGVGGALVFERLLRGAPVLAPMVFANFGLMGLIALWDPAAPVAD